MGETLQIRFVAEKKRIFAAIFPEVKHCFSWTRIPGRAEDILGFTLTLTYQLVFGVILLWSAYLTEYCLTSLEIISAKLGIC